MKRRGCLFRALATAWSAACLPGFGQGLAGLEPGEWYEAPDSHLESVKPNPLPPGYFPAVMASWSGGAYDAKRDRLLVWGGGHSDYSGNEVYAFDLGALKWERLTEPSADVGGVESSGEYPDGRPRSRHTYNYVQYVPAIDRFCTFGGAGMYPSGQVGSSKTHCFDPGAKAWERKADAIQSAIGGLSAVDPATGMVWMQGTGNQAHFSLWDPRADKWTLRSTYAKGWMEYYFTAAAGEGKFLAIGNGRALLWDLADPTRQPVEPVMTGSREILLAVNPGLDFDPVRKRFVAWAGGKDVFYLDPATWIWHKADLAPGNTVTLTTAAQYGTFGRFRYIPSRDLFIGVNRTNENVFIFRPPHPISIAAFQRGGRFASKVLSFGFPAGGRWLVGKGAEAWSVDGGRIPREGFASPPAKAKEGGGR